jgi:cysteine synthase A
MKIYENILQTVGRTPIIKFNRMGHGLPGEIFLKLEFFNPLSSVKDRIGTYMIEMAEKEGLLKKGQKIIEPTSGNTGIALAFTCASKGYPLTLVMPETMSMERRTLLLMLGAELVLTPAALGMKGAIAKSLEMFSQDQSYFMPCQFENKFNPEIHRQTTAVEIWEDMGGKIDIFVSGVGTGGTITGVGEVLKSKNPNIQIVAVEPEESPVLSGGNPGPHKIQGIGAGFIPQIVNQKVINSVQKVSSEEAVKMAKEVIKSEGIPVGISSGAAIVAGMRLAALPENKGKRILCMIPSSTERYLSTVLAEEERNKAAKLTVSEVNPDFLAKVPKQ